MKKVAVLATMLISGVIVSHVNAQDECSNRDLRGVYSFLASGTFAGAPFAAAGQTTYDGAGNAAGLIQISLNGTILPSAAPSKWTATYKVDPSSCTTTKTIDLPTDSSLGPLSGAQLPFFITAGAGFKELRFIATAPGAAITGTAKKQ
jgi:hypothetical protein